MRHTLFSLFVFFTSLFSTFSLSAHILYVNDQLKTDAKKGQFQTINEALRYAETLDHQEWTDIRIAPSVYWIDDPDDPTVRTAPAGQSPFGLRVKLSKVRLIGESDDAADVVIACNRGQTQGSEGNFTMLGIEGDDIEAQNITFGNYCNVDLVYPRNPKLNRAKRNEAIVQAQLAICRGDRYHLVNCRFISRLNLCPFVGPDHVLFERCYFECTDDALCGTGTYRQCRFTFYSGKPFYATSRQGAVFEDCDIHTLVHGRQYLTKASSPITLTDCRWTSEDPNLVIAWTPKPNPKDYCCMTRCTLNGQPYELGPTPDVPMPVEPLNLGLKGQTEIRAGQWTLDAYKPLDTAHYDWKRLYGSSPTDDAPAPWSFGEGVDAAEGCFGLIPHVRGARMMYAGREGEQYHDQTLTMTIHPCKAAGQGFGSATMQYFDVCIKFQPETLTGYGIRFIRTPQYDHAVEVYLVAYHDGEVERISEPQRCDLFHVGCHLTLMVKEDQLSARIENADFAPKDAEGHPMAQELTATITANLYGGIHLQHTGSLGPSGLVISEMHCRY